MPQGLDEQALVRLAGNDRRAALAPFAKALPRIEPQLALQLLGAGRVALVAIGDQHRADVLLEEVDPLRIVFGRGGSRRLQHRQGDRPTYHALHRWPLENLVSSSFPFERRWFGTPLD